MGASRQIKVRCQIPQIDCLQNSEEKAISVKLARKDFHHSAGGIWVRFCRMKRVWIEVPMKILWLERCENLTETEVGK